MTISREMLLLKDYIMGILKNDEMQDSQPLSNSDNVKYESNLINSNEQSEEK